MNVMTVRQKSTIFIGIDDKNCGNDDTNCGNDDTTCGNDGTNLGNAFNTNCLSVELDRLKLFLQVATILGTS